MGRVEIVNFTVKHRFIKTVCEKRISEIMNIETQDIKRLLFIIELDEIGENETANAFLKANMIKHKSHQNHELTDAVAALIVISDSENFTKTYAKKFIFLANEMGCEFIGHPLVELTKKYINFKTWSKVVDETLEQIAVNQIHILIDRLGAYEMLHKSRLNLLVLHAGHKEISNTLMLWDMVKSKLNFSDAEIEMKELHVEEGNITDCYGCSFETCNYYALEKSCFYGGFVVEELYPLIEEADFVVWICPNYNDSISAKLMAVINRLTALYRKISFNDKYILGVVVSGNSGNDTVASQLIGALNVNKGFRLPSKFAIMAIANDPGEILEVENLNEEIVGYVDGLYKIMNKNISKS